MIDQVHFEGFKSLENVTVPLGRLTVLVGPNGSGKSSLLQGIQLISLSTSPPPTREAHTASTFAAIFSGLRNPERIAGPGRPRTMKLSMRARGGKQLTLAFSLPGNEEWSLRVELNEGPIVAEIAGGRLNNGAAQKLLHPSIRDFCAAAYLQLDARQMSRTSFSQDERPQMGATGAGLASVLAWMKGAAEDDLALITRDLARVVPGVQRIRTFRERASQADVDTVEINGQQVLRPTEKVVVGDRFELEFSDHSSIPGGLLSEGTLLALGLLTKLHESNRPHLMLLDDIDRGLHLEAQADLMTVLRELLDTDPQLQVVATTHSPYLVSLCQPEEVRVFALDNSRHTHVLPLTAHPEFDKWKFGTQTGELWAALGHSWVAAESAVQAQ